VLSKMDKKYYEVASNVFILTIPLQKFNLFLVPKLKGSESVELEGKVISKMLKVG
jgi:hypothetical protein